MIINDSLGFNIKTVFTTKFMLLIEIHQIFEFTIDNSNSLELVVCVCVCSFRDNTRQCNACGKIQRERDRAIWKFESCFCHALDSYNILLLLLFRIQSNFTCVFNHVIVIVHVDCWLWIANLKPSSHELMRNSSSNRNHNRVNQSRSTFDLCEITAPKRRNDCDSLQCTQSAQTKTLDQLIDVKTETKERSICIYIWSDLSRFIIATVDTDKKRSCWKFSVLLLTLALDMVLLHSTSTIDTQVPSVCEFIFSSLLFFSMKCARNKKHTTTKNYIHPFECVAIFLLSCTFLSFSISIFIECTEKKPHIFETTE